MNIDCKQYAGSIGDRMGNVVGELAELEAEGKGFDMYSVFGCMQACLLAGAGFRRRWLEERLYWIGKWQKISAAVWGR
jgi:hypothetical protein